MDKLSIFAVNECKFDECKERDLHFQSNTPDGLSRSLVLKRQIRYNYFKYINVFMLLLAVQPEQSDVFISFQFKTILT